MEIGDIVQDRYRIIRFVGRGGMGAVYLCEDQRLPGKHWALKEMLNLGPVVDDQIKESFEREVKMLAGLRHRNLPVIVDYFSIGGRPYLVMEYIEGEDLAQYVDRTGKPKETQVLQWALELTQVLDYLHRQERPVIFRDLKPENIIVTEDLHVKLVDFGLARFYEPGKRRDTQASGSVGYAPPEQWEDLRQTDARSDIYSLGATLYFLLTGKPPSPIYGSHRIRPYRPSIDTGIEALVLKCLQPDPGHRYENTEELLKDLLFLLSDDKHQTGMPEAREERAKPLVVQRVPKAPSPNRPRPRIKNRFSVSPVLLVLLVLASLSFLVGVTIGMLPHSDKPPGERVFSILERTEAAKEEARQKIADKAYAAAIPILDGLVTRYPEDPEAHILRSNAYALLSGKVRRLPVLTSMTGKDREGFQMLYGLALAQEELNREATNAGEALWVLDLTDDKSQVEDAIAWAQKVGASEDYAVGVGPFTSQHTIAVAPLVTAKKFPIVTPMASDPRVWAAGKFVFTASEPDTKKVEALAEYFLKKGFTRGSVFRDDSSIVSRSYADDFIDYFQNNGGYLAASDTYSANAVSFEPLIEQALSNGSDFIFLSEYRGPIILRFLRQLRETDSVIILAAQNAAFSDTSIDLREKEVEGLLTSTYFYPQAKTEKVQAFESRFRQTFNSINPSHREANSYDVMRLVAQAVAQVGFDKEKVRDYLASVGDERPLYNGVTGEFSPKKPAEARKPYLVRIRGGRYVLVD